MKTLWILFLIISYLNIVSAKEIKFGLFATVINVANNDMLNVREKPDYHSRKVGTFPNGAEVYIDKCVKTAHSRWCYIHPDSLIDYGGTSGWVNAKFLRESNYGYVRIKGHKNNCFVSLKCQDKKCLIVTKLLGKETVTGLETEWFERSRLIAADKFSAMKDTEEGYCVSLSYIDEFLQKRNSQLSGETHHNTAFDRAEMMIEALSDKNLSDIISLIHPVKGIRLSEMIIFGSKNDKLFSRSKFKHYWNNGRKIKCGYTYGRGDPIVKNLKEYVDSLSLHPETINRTGEVSLSYLLLIMISGMSWEC